MARSISSKKEACKRLIKTCETKLLEGNFPIYTVRGVEVTHQEINDIIFYCEYFIDKGSIGGLMPPRGSVGSLLRKIEL